MADEEKKTEENPEEEKRAKPKIDLGKIKQVLGSMLKVKKVFNLNIFIIIAIIVVQPLLGLGIMRYVVLKNSILTPQKISHLMKITAVDSLNNYKAKIVRMEEEKVKKEGSEEEKDHVLGTMYELEGEIIINPKDTYAIRFMVLSVALELGKDTKKAKVKIWEPIIKDNIIECMMHKRMDYYTNPENIVALRAEIKNIIEDVLGEGSIQSVYFSKFVLQ